jgi:putative PIN family toxin of toxin-antitoxin system
VPNKYIVVFDTNVFVQALTSKGGPAVRCLEYFEQGRITLAVSRATLEEIEDVLSRSHFRLKYPWLTDESVAALLERLMYRGIYVRQVPQHFTYPRDPDDEPYLNLAIEIAADYLVSRDRDMLDLMLWEREEGREFQKRFRSLKIVAPDEFLRIVDAERELPLKG